MPEVCPFAPAGTPERHQVLQISAAARGIVATRRWSYNLMLKSTCCYLVMLDSFPEAIEIRRFSAAWWRASKRTRSSPPYHTIIATHDKFKNTRATPPISYILARFCCCCWWSCSILQSALVSQKRCQHSTLSITTPTMTTSKTSPRTVNV